MLTDDASAQPIADDASDECAICFEAIHERIQLPCQCRVLYCSSCWDHALAASFNDCGHSRCPTCRRPVRVDFDAAAARLVFSSADEADGESMGAIVNRLAEQAAPLMTRLLRSFGEAHPTLRARAQAAEASSVLASKPIRELKALITGLGGSPEGCLDRADLVERALETAGGAARISEYLATVVEAAAYPPSSSAPDDDGSGGGGEAPLPSLRCVCKGRLVRVSGRDRAMELFKSQYGAQLDASQLEALLDAQAASGATFVICDLCDATLRTSEHVYTCGNGERTILHPTTYDVCGACFVRYAVHGLGDDGLAKERREL